MTLGDWITWLTFAAGAYALGSLAWRRWGALILHILSMLFAPRLPEITSSSADDARPMASRPRTDEAQDGRTPTQAPDLRPVTLDGARSLRAHGYTRDEARAFLKGEGLSLGNNTWSQAAPADDDADYVTPYAGRRTKAQYYPENPELEYAEPTS